MKSMQWIMSIGVLLAAVERVSADNVDLSTVPNRDTVQLTIYNSEDITLVRETRIVTFRKGVNPLQFSWANTLIDASSVELRFLSNADKLELLDTTFPHEKPQMLYWNVQSELDGEARVEITYFTSGVSWSADYVAVAGADESGMNLEGFVRVTNNSGEDYEDAQVRLVVGTINLVEKIAQLAKVPMEKVRELPQSVQAEMRFKAVRDGVESADRLAGGLTVAGRRDEKQIVKEGLSEYFIYTVEGTETVRHGWSKRMRSFEGRSVPFRTQYRFRPAEYGEQLVRLYLLTNDEKSHLGTTPLPDGMVRVFRDNGRDGLSFLTAQPIKYVPIGDKIELNLGVNPEVIFELIRLRVWRDNLWLQVHGSDVIQRADDGQVRLEPNSNVVGWDEHELYSQRIRNYSGKPIDVEVRRQHPGHVAFRSGLPAKLFDFQTVEYTARVESGRRADLYHEIVRHSGRNQKQQNVVLEEAAVKP